MNYPCLPIEFDKTIVPFFPKTKFELAPLTDADKKLGKIAWTAVACDYDAPLETPSYIHNNGSKPVISPSFLLPSNAPDTVLTHKANGTDITSPFTKTALGAFDGNPVKVILITEPTDPKKADPAFPFVSQYLYYRYSVTNTFHGSLADSLQLGKRGNNWILFIGTTPDAATYYYEGSSTRAGIYVKGTFTITLTETADVLHPFPYMPVKIPLIARNSRVANFCRDQIKNLPVTCTRPGATGPLNLSLESTTAYTGAALAAAVAGAVADSTIQTNYQDVHTKAMRSWIANGLNSYFTDICTDGLRTIPNLLGGDEWKYILYEGGTIKPLYKLVTDDYRQTLSEKTNPVFTDGWMYNGTTWVKRAPLRTLPLIIKNSSGGDLVTVKGPIVGPTGALQDVAMPPPVTTGPCGTTAASTGPSLCYMNFNGSVTATLRFTSPDNKPVYHCASKRWELPGEIYLSQTKLSSNTGACGLCKFDPMSAVSFYPQTVLWYNDVGTTLADPAGCYYLGTYKYSGALYKSLGASGPTANTGVTCKETSDYNTAALKYLWDKAGEAAFNALANTLKDITISVSGAGGTGPDPKRGPFFLSATGATGPYSTHSLFDKGQPIPFYFKQPAGASTGPTSILDPISPTGANTGYLLGGSKWYTQMKSNSVMAEPWLPFVAAQLDPTVTIAALTANTGYQDKYTQEVGGCENNDTVSEDCCILRAASTDKTAYYPYGIFRDTEPCVTYWLEGSTDEYILPKSTAIYENMHMRFAGPLSWNGFLAMKAYDFSTGATRTGAKAGTMINETDIYDFGNKALKLQSLAQLDREWGPFIYTDTSDKYTVQGAAPTNPFPASTSTEVYTYVEIPSVWDTYNSDMKNHVLATMLGVVRVEQSIKSTTAGTGPCIGSNVVTYNWTVYYYSAAEIIATRFNGTKAIAFCKLTLASTAFSSKDPNEHVALLSGICKDQAAAVKAAFSSGPLLVTGKLYKRGANGHGYTGACYSSMTGPCSQSFSGSTGACFIEHFQDKMLLKVKPVHCLDDNASTVTDPGTPHYNLIRVLKECLDPEVNCLNDDATTRLWRIKGYANDKNQTLARYVEAAAQVCQGCPYGTLASTISEVKPIWLTSTTVPPCVEPPYNSQVKTKHGFKCTQLAMLDKALSYVIVLVGLQDCSDPVQAGCSKQDMIAPDDCSWEWDSDCCAYLLECDDGSGSYSTKCKCNMCVRACVKEGADKLGKNRLCINQQSGFFQSRDGSPAAIREMMDCYRNYTGDYTAVDPAVVSYPGNCGNAPTLYCKDTAKANTWTTKIVPKYLD